MGIFDWFKGKSQPPPPPSPTSKSGADIVARLDRYGVPGDLERLTSGDISSILGRLFNDLVAFEKALDAKNFPIRFLNVTIPEADAEDIDSSVRPTIDALLRGWVKGLEKIHGSSGASLVSELAKQRGHSFRAGRVRMSGGGGLPTDSSIREERAEAERVAREARQKAEAERMERLVREGVEQAKLYPREPSGEMVTMETEGDVVVTARIQTEFDGPEATKYLEALLKRDDLQLRRLVLGLWESTENDYGAALELLGKTGPHAHLEDFVVGDYEQDEMEISWTHIGNLAEIYGAMPALKRLRVRGGSIELGALRHDTLEELRIETGGLSADAVASVAAMECPAMRHLECWFGDEGYGAEGNMELLAPLLERRFPNLAYLGLRNAEFSDDIAKAIVSSPLAAQVETLDLSLGTLTDVGAQALIEGRDAFKRIQTVDIAENFVGRDVAKALVAAFPSVLGATTQDEPDEYDGEVHCYVSVGE